MFTHRSGPNVFGWLFPMLIVTALSVFPIPKTYCQTSARLLYGKDTIVVVCRGERTFELSYRLAGVSDSASLVIDPVYDDSWAFQSVDSDASGLHINAGGYQIEVTTPPLVISVIDSIGNVVFRTMADTGFTSRACYATISRGTYYGLDNRPWGLVRGYWQSWVFSGDQGNASGMLVWSAQGLGLLADVDDGSALVDGAGGTLMYTKDASIRQNNVLFLTLGSPRMIMKSVSRILGAPHMPPLWALGYIHSKWGQDQAEVYSVANRYRAEHIPLDAFVLDFEWMDWGNPWGEFTWNPTNFPSAASGVFADSLRALGVSLMGIRKPRIHVEQPEGVYATAHGYFLPNTQSDDYVSKRPVALLDFYNPAVRNWYWQSLTESTRDPLARGIRALWNDEAGYSRSLYANYMQKAEYDGQRSYNTERVFSLNRNYFIGANRLAYGLWTGDIQSDYHTLRNQVLSLQTSALIGAGWWSMDIGGFWGLADSTRETAERFIRWMEFGAFVPIYRTHGIIHSNREIWNYGQEAERISAKYIGVRYTMLPYIYGAFRSFVDEGLPPVHPLVFDYPQDGAAQSESRAYLFGPSLIVAPVVDSLSRTATFYLPGSTWVNYWNDSILVGGAEVSLNVALDNIPVLVRRGAILAERLPGRYSLDSDSFRDIRFHVYSGASDTMTYYEDDFTTYGYETGAFAKISYTHRYDHDVEKIVVGSQIGNYRLPQRRGYFVVHCISGKIENVLYNHSKLRVVSFDSIYRVTGAAWALDEMTDQIVISIPDPFAPGEIELDPVVDYSKQADSLDGPLVEVVPNPSVGAIRWRIDSPIEQTIETTITSVLGNQVLHRSDELRRGLNLLGYNGSYLAAGAYDITVQGAGWKRTVKAVVLSR